MPDKMQFDLVSPERSLVSGLATAVQIPGAEGDLTAMPGHAPLITTLRPGILKVSGDDGPAEFAVTGGFAEINSDATTVPVPSICFRCWRPAARSLPISCACWDARRPSR